MRDPSRFHYETLATISLTEHRWRLLGATAVGAFMSPFDGTVVSVALPKLAPALHLGFVGALWIQAIYLLALTVLLVPAGRLADAWGGMRLYRLGAALFALTSVAAGASSSATWMLGARCAQGVAAALLSATSTALVTEAFPSSERGKALGINVTAVYVGLAAGPVLGGVLTEQAGWRWIFYVNIPVAVASLAWGWRLADDRRSAPFRLDLGGVALLATGLGLTLVGVTLAPVWGWTMPSSLVLISAGFGGVVAFVALESRRPDPLLDVGLFRRSRVFAAANFAALANYTAFFAVTVLTAVFLQVSGGRSPAEAGYLLVSQPVVMAALSSTAGRASDRVGSRWLASGGMAVIAVGLLLLSRLPAKPSIPALTVSLVVIGLGMAAFSSPNTSAVMGAAPRDRLGVASGTIGTMRFLGQALSIAILGSLATSRLGAAGQAVLFSGHAQSPQAAVSFVDGYRLAMLVGAGIAAAGALASLTRE